METCQRCGTVLPTAPGARYCPNCGEMYATASDPTQAFAAVGRGGDDSAVSGPGGAAGSTGMTWELPPEPGPTKAFPAPGPTDAFPAPGNPGFGPAPVDPDHYAELFRPAPNNPNATQVMAPVEAVAAAGSGAAAGPVGAAGYGQPAYDQPIDYQAGGRGGPYSEPYDGSYADDYDAGPAARPRSSRAAMVGIGVAAGAVLVIVVSLITLGGGDPAPAAAPGSSATEVVTPTSGATGAPATSQDPTTSASSTAPTTTAPSTAPHPPGTLALGVTGNDVKWLQGRLKQLHFYNGEINGTFDAATQAAVVAFQDRTHPADPSGIVGRSTKTALIAAGSKPQLSMLNVVEKHGKGGVNPEDVKRLQRALSSALNTSVKATGVFDVDTFGAVVQYQAAMGLGADGVAGDKVWSALQQGRIVG